MLDRISVSAKGSTSWFSNAARGARMRHCWAALPHSYKFPFRSLHFRPRDAEIPETCRRTKKGEKLFSNESRETSRRYNGTTTIKSEEHHRAAWPVAPRRRSSIDPSPAFRRQERERESGQPSLCFISQPPWSNERKKSANFSHSSVAPTSIHLINRIPS